LVFLISPTYSQFYNKTIKKSKNSSLLFIGNLEQTAKINTAKPIVKYIIKENAQKKINFL